MANIGDLSVSIGADTSGLKRGAAEVSSTLKKTESDVKRIGQSLSGIGAGIVAAFSVGTVMQIGRAVFDVTSEFQKFEAVLTNTLGSGSAAQAALSSIQEFASRTPYSVSELTNSFVKLANQGFKPTTNQLRQLGDLAASTGKSFDQLTEGIIDAQTGEFERLKEFGIRAQKEGDKVKFTFKGVETQVDFTSESIREYITSLGDAEGVSGAMAAISETLSGQLSNLGDSFDQLLVQVGKSNTGVFAGIIGALNKITNATTEYLKRQDLLSGDNSDIINSAFSKILETDRENLLKNIDVLGQTMSAESALATAVESATRPILEMIDANNERITQYSELLRDGEAYDALSKKEIENLQNQIKYSQEGNEKLQARLQQINQLAQSQSKLNQTAKEEQGILAKLKEELKSVQKARDAATSEKAIQGYNVRIIAINKTIERLEKLGQTYGLITQQAEKIRQLEEARAKANTIEDVGKFNDLIANAKEYADVLEEVSLKEYELSQMVLKPIEAKPINIKIESTEAGRILDQLASQMAQVSAESEVFGTSFDSASAKISLLEQAIVSLLETGIAPSHHLVQGLKEQIDDLSKTFQQITIDVSGMASDAFSSLAESFGQLASGAQNVDDFGKSILAAISNFVGQLGKAMIATGTASLALKQVVSNPYAAIAAGAVLVALSSATKSMLSKGPSSPSLSTGPTGGGNMGSVNNYMHENSQPVEIYGKLKGSDIILSSQKQEQRNYLRT